MTLRYINPESLPVDTLVGVATLSKPEYLIEVDAIAVIDDASGE